ncbi:MAG: hypothetical protein COC14_00190 [Burkholderiaceae bacterium]|nr:MAG: hypothetical protein COC14_00190 [Burkholderiaceae bacterium]
MAMDAFVLMLTWSWLFVFMLLAAVAGMGLIALTRKRAIQSSNDNDWALGECHEITNPDRPVKEPCSLSIKTMMQGILCFGQPGAGKSESFSLGYVEFVRKTLGKGMAFFDGKGDLDIIRKYIGCVGQPDYFFSTELEHSASINLMAGEAAAVVDRLSAVLIGNSASTSYYSDEQYTALNRVIPVLLGLDQRANLRDLYVVLTVEDAGFELIRRARESNNVTAEQLSLAKAWFDVPTDDRIKNVAGLLNRLFIYVSGEHTDRLNDYEPDIDIHTLIENDQSVYFHLPFTKYSVAVAIALSEMFAVEARARQLAGGSRANYYPLLFDDWGRFVHEGFSPFMARARSAAMPAAFSFQSVAQIKEVSPIFLEQMDDLAATKIFLRVQGESTIDYAKRMLGFYEIAEVSASEDNTRSGNSVSVRERERVTGRNLRELATGQAYISTQVTQGLIARNPFWLMNFPLPEFGDWASIALPKYEHVEDLSIGLRFWERYLNPHKLDAIRKLAEQSKAEEEVSDLAAIGEPESLVDNPGWGNVAC